MGLVIIPKWIEKQERELKGDYVIGIDSYNKDNDIILYHPTDGYNIVKLQPFNLIDYFKPKNQSDIDKFGFINNNK